MYKREDSQILTNRIAEPRDKIQVISGPRQVGKSTMVKQVLEECAIPYLSISADNVSPTDTFWIGETWESARARMRLSGVSEFLLVIDEIHKLLNWSEAVKKEWDDDTRNNVNIKVVLLGSSRLLLKSGLTESLAGRYEIIPMTHWSYREMREAFGFSMDQYIYFGGYPGGARYIQDERRWRRYIKESIITPAIERDVLMTKKVYKPVLMRQLFDLGCTYSGKELSLNKMLGQLNDVGNVTTLAEYLTTLGESRLLCGLQKYAQDAARKYNSVPKLLVYNTALLSAQVSSTFSKALTTPSLWGRWVESTVGTFLLAQTDKYDYKIHYWREKDNEVDYIISDGTQCVAIEVKSGRRTNNAGLPLFRDKFHPKYSLIVGSDGIPLEDFLSSDISTLFE